MCASLMPGNGVLLFTSETSLQSLGIRLKAAICGLARAWQAPLYVCCLKSSHIRQHLTGRLVIYFFNLHYYFLWPLFLGCMLKNYAGAN
jgi:hypothetical protein